MDAKQRFSDRVAFYHRFRPFYPKELLSILQKHGGLSEDFVVADIGSGTGISSKLFLDFGAKVIGVEPNEEMRNAAQHFFGNDKNFIPSSGNASNTLLAENEVDAIVCGQSFHWFFNDESLQEWRRIAKNGAPIFILWYDRDLTHPFQKAYQELIDEFSTDYDEITHTNIKDEMMTDLLGEDLKKFEITFQQTFDLEGLIGRTLSCSFMPHPHHSKYVEMLSALKSLFSRFEENGIIIFAYSLRIYIAFIKK